MLGKGLLGINSHTFAFKELDLSLWVFIHNGVSC